MSAFVAGNMTVLIPPADTGVPGTGCQLAGGLKLAVDCRVKGPPGQPAGQLTLISPLEPLAWRIGPNDCASSMNESNCAVATLPLLNAPSSMPTCIGRPAKAVT